MAGFRVAVAGATGLVGRTILRVLEERSFPVGGPRTARLDARPGTRAHLQRRGGRGLALTEAVRGMRFCLFLGGSNREPAVRADRRTTLRLCHRQ